MSDPVERADHSPWDLETIHTLAQEVGTPFYIFNAVEIRRRIREIRKLADSSGIQARYAMKACSTRRVLEELRSANLWIDAVSGNEILRAVRAGFPGGTEPPVILYTADVFRDNGLEVLKQHQIFPNIGTPQMIEHLASAGYRGPIGIRLNPGFGHGHVAQCDTGGPSSKHGIWHEDARAVLELARKRGLSIALLHAHIGTGPEIAEFRTNIQRLVAFSLERIREFPDASCVNLGGGIPHPYRPGAPRINLEEWAGLLRESRESLNKEAGREIRLEMEPGRYFVASAGSLITRVHGMKSTRSNDKGPGQQYILVDAGFCDLIRPAMYGSYHRIEVLGKDEGPLEPFVVAGPICESGDVFTRDADEVLVPRNLPRPVVGDLLAIHDAGAYGNAMSSNYNSFGRVPQVWLDEGKAFLIARRETVDDLTRTECFEEL